MKVLMITKWFAFVAVLGLIGCSTASGPIKGYDGKGNIPLEQLARVYFPPAINVVEVNGIEKDTPFIVDGMNELHLTPGTHEVTLEYEMRWGSEVSGSLVQSDEVTLRVDVQAGDELVIKFPAVNDIWEATTMAKKFNPWLENKKGGRVSSRKVKHNVLNKGNSNLSAEEVVARQNPLKKLQFWWKLADKKDREAFQKWVRER